LFTLQAVLVHNGQEVTRGHYVVFTKLVGHPGWALCNDDKVQWVSEMEVLAQEASILIYAQPDAFQYTRTEQLADQIAATVQSGTVILIGTAHHHSDTEASPPSGMEALIRKMTTHDNQPSFAEKSRLKRGIEHRGPHSEGVDPHLHEERGPPSTSSLYTSLPHYRSAMEDQPLKSEKCSSDDQPSDVEKINLGYAEQMNGSTHEKQPTPVIVRSLGSPNSSAGGPSDSYNESPDKCWSKKLDKQFQSTLKQKLFELDLSGNLSAMAARHQSNTTVSALIINRHQSTSCRTGAEPGLVLFAQVVPIPRLEGN
jgi:hypothetical protein